MTCLRNGERNLWVSFLLLLSSEVPPSLTTKSSFNKLKIRISVCSTNWEKNQNETKKPQKNPKTNQTNKHQKKPTKKRQPKSQTLHWDFWKGFLAASVNLLSVMDIEHIYIYLLSLFSDFFSSWSCFCSTYGPNTLTRVHILLCSTLSMVPIFASANEEVEKILILCQWEGISSLKSYFHLWLILEGILAKWYLKVRWHEFLERPGDVINMLKDFSLELVLCHH